MRRVWMLLAPLAVCAFAAAEPFGPVSEHSHAERVTAAGHVYFVDVGGGLDMDNTATRHHGTWGIAFQNNVELVIANTGNAPAVNPRVEVNGRGTYRDWESMLEDFTAGAQSAQERIYLIWEGVRRNRRHDYPLFACDDYHDPVRFLNIYGGGFCDDAGMVGSALYHAAGFNAANGGEDPFVRALHGHMMCEVWHGGDFQFMDIDQGAFYLDWYNEKPVSGDTLARDPYLAIREQAFGPDLGDWNTGPHNAAALFGADDERSGRGVLGHTMDYTLRPGERVVFRWDHRGKYPWAREDIEHRYYGNSKLVFAPPLETVPEAPGVRVTGFRAEDGVLVAETFAPRIEIATQSCYTICGATLHFTWEDPTRGGVLRVEAAPGGGPFKTVWETQTGRSGGEEHIALDEALGVRGGPPLREYTVRITGLDVIALRIGGIRLETDLYAYPIALPRLSVGSNRIAYHDDTPGPRVVEVAWRWREADAAAGIPQPPAMPVTPAHAATVRSTLVPFAWPAVEGADRYALRVSRAPHMRYPYRPNYDIHTDQNQYEVPYPGMFRHKETYYWQVRPRRNGVWGPWSPRWELTWEGPMPPVGVRIEEEDGALYLAWKPNGDGLPPESYRVYGSNIRGFVPCAETHTLPVLGETPGNLVAEDITESRFLVARADSQPGEGLYRAYYRVSAVRGGVESGPSPQALLPRPLVYGLPDEALAAGRPFEHGLRTVRSPGALQYRYDPPGHDYWEREAHRFELAAGPEWLHIDADTGRLHGTPPPDAAGTHEVRVRVTTHFPHEVPLDAKSGNVFQRVLPEFDPDYVCAFTLRVAAPEHDRESTP